MREERGQLVGDVTISEPCTLWGSIAGNVFAVAGSKLYVRGAVYGTLTAMPGGRVHIFGNVSGDLIVMPKAKVIHSGYLGGDAVNKGGRLYIEGSGKVVGKVRTSEEGKTTVEPPPSAATERGDRRREIAD